MLELSPLINAMDAPAALATPDGRIVLHNPQFAVFSAQSDIPNGGSSLQVLWEPDRLEELRSYLEKIRQSSPQDLPGPLKGTSLSAKPICLEGTVYLLCQPTSDRAARDPSDSKLSLAGKLQLAVESSGIGIWEYDPKTSRVFWDDHMLAIYGLPPGRNHLASDFWAQFLHPEDAEEVLANAENGALTKSDLSLEFRIIRADGEIRHIRSLARFEELSASETRLIGVNIDVTEDVKRTQELERTRRKLEHDSRHDALTGLGNRRLMDEKIAAIVQDEKTGDMCAMHLDLDRFKDINDRYGHAAGDAVLVHVAKTLRYVLRDASLICRLGGDEFFVLFVPAPEPQKLKAMADQVIDACKASFLFKGQACTFGISIGSASGRDAKEIFAQSDTALYAAKNAGRCCYRAYMHRTGSRTSGRLKRRQDIVDALSQDRIECWYQPQFDAHTHRLVGAEALARLRSDSGTNAPDDFLPLAEETGLLSDIEEFIFQRALEDQTAWAKGALVYPGVSVNLSKHQLTDPTLIDRISRYLQPHHQITFELLESAFLDDPCSAEHKTIQKLRDLDVAIELDDFGSGHASLVAMMSVRPHRIKIDQLLTRNIATHPKELAALQAVASIARTQDIGVVLEGIETSEQLDAARNVDCDVLQGYALSPPLRADDFARMLEADRRQASKA